MILLEKLILKAESDLVEKACKECINRGTLCNLIVLQRKLGVNKLVFFSLKTSDICNNYPALTVILNEWQKKY